MKHLYEFEEFRLDAENPSLWRGGELVPIYPKALDILILLVGRKGEIVSRDELLETVWQETFVEESNITYTVSQLRKTLGDKKFIQTVPKRGYRFVADVREVSRNGKPEVDDLIAPGSNKQTKTPVRWNLIVITLLGVLFLSSFAVWWSVDKNRGLSRVPVNQRNIRTMAILPLKTAGDDEKSKTMAMGLTDALINRLGSLNRFAVRPLSSVGSVSQNLTKTIYRSARN